MSYLSWPTSTVVEKLRGLNLEQYADSFRSNDIDGSLLPFLTEKHMKDLGMTLVGHRLKLVKYIRSLRRGVDPLSKASSGNNGKSQASGSQSSARPSASSGSVSNNSYQEPAKRSIPAAPSQSAVKKKPAAAPPKNYYNDVDDDDEDYNPPPPQRKSPAKKSGTSSNQLNTSLRRNPGKGGKLTSGAPPPPPPPDGDDDRVECAYCHRRFASDRIGQHEAICARMSTKKKKVFDSSKQRLQGTEAAQYARKAASYQPERPKPSKYKAEHEKLVASLRAARKYQAYEKAKEEGRAVGPPPELPKYEIEDDDRVQCPICGRKFGPEQAQRHIAVCERMNGGGGGRMRTSTNRRIGKR